MRKSVFLLLFAFIGMNSTFAQAKPQSFAEYWFGAKPQSNAPKSAKSLARNVPAKAKLRSATVAPGDVITLDLSKSLNPETFSFDPSKGHWTETYNGEDYPMIEFEHFAFSHLIDGDDWDGSYWDGFTLCSGGDNTNYGSGGSANWVDYQWGNMAGGGIKTVVGNAVTEVQQGIPYLLAFCSNMSMEQPCQIILTDADGPYESVGVYINANPWPYYGNLNGDSFARKLDQDGDYFKLLIHGLDDNYEDNGKVVEYYLAKNEGGGIENLQQSSGWEWVDLSALGEVFGFYYTMTSSDTDPTWGMNTAAYFCMDKLQVRKPQTAVPVDVTIGMNAVSTTMTLQNKTTLETVEVGTPASNNYSFAVVPGDYILSAYGTNGTTLNGTIELTVTDAPTQTFKICTVTTYAANSGWVLNADYTINLSVSSKEGGLRNTTLGSSVTAGRAAFLVYSGDTFYVQFVPSQSRATEGYLNFDGSGTVTGNTTKTGSMPMGYVCTLTIPEGATAFVGKKGAHFQRFTEIEPDEVTATGGNTVYTYKLAGSQQYNYRISQPNKLTYANLFTKTASVESLTITPEMLAGDPKTIDRNVSSNGGSNVADIFLNINEKGHLNLSQGKTYQLVNIRVWQTVNSITDNYFIEPDYHYTVVNEDGQADNSVVTVDENGKITTVGNGTAIVLVTYDAINVASATGGPFFGAIWPENTGVFVVSVGAAEAGITPNMTINKTLNASSDKNAGINADAELDVFYYLEEAGGYDYAFTPTGVTSVSVARPVVGTNMTTYNGFSTTGVAANPDGSYTIRLICGRNIVKLTSATGSVYQVLTAKPVIYTVTNASRLGENIQPGDKVSVRFNTLYHPAPKLAGIYNMNAYIQYTADGNVVTGTGSQYAFANTDNCQTISAVIPADRNIADNFTFTGGVIKVGGTSGLNYGDPFGNHRDITLEIGRNPNFTAALRLAYFGALPDISIRLSNATNLDQTSTENRIAVYPNPFTDYIIVNATAEGRATIYDLSGKPVLTATVQTGSNRIDASALPKGMYMLKLDATVVKIVK
jgi:hypothetical protein